jgi:hypothetical protein
LLVTLKGGDRVRSQLVLAAGEGLHFNDYYPDHYALSSSQLHLLPFRDWGRCAWLLIGFPPAPAFAAADVLVLSVAGHDTLLSRQP